MHSDGISHRVAVAAHMAIQRMLLAQAAAAMGKTDRQDYPVGH
jgi:hypothetical protein